MLEMLTRVATYCNDLALLDATTGVRQLVSALTNDVAYLDGGWQQLVDALQAKLSSPVVVNAKAESVASKAGCITVTTKDSSFDADAVVIAPRGPASVSSLLAGTSAWAQQWSRDEIPVFATALDLGLSSLPAPGCRFALGVDAPPYMSLGIGWAQKECLQMQPLAADMRRAKLRQLAWRNNCSHSHAMKRSR